MRFPTTLDGQYLVYHRLTGLHNGSIADVFRLIANNFSLTPYNERGEPMDELPPEMHGIDAIDVAAGDGGAVFCTPFKPVTTGMWGKPGFNRTPGIAFRLSDLLACCPVSVRPRDYQVFYNDFIDRSALAEAFKCMTRSVEDVDNHPFYLDMLSTSLELLRTAEQWNEDVFTVLDAAERTGRALPFEMPRLYAKDAEKAVDGAVEFVSEFSYCDNSDPDEFYSNAALVGEATESIEAALIEQYEKVWEAWDEMRRDQIEVLAWGSLPLSKACIVFDQQQIVRGPCKLVEQ